MDFWRWNPNITFRNCPAWCVCVSICLFLMWVCSQEGESDGLSRSWASQSVGYAKQTGRRRHSAIEATSSLHPHRHPRADAAWVYIYMYVIWGIRGRDEMIHRRWKHDITDASLLFFWCQQPPQKRNQTNGWTRTERRGSSNDAWGHCYAMHHRHGLTWLLLISDVFV